MDKFPIAFDYDGKRYEGWINPLDDRWPSRTYHLVLNGLFIGTLILSEDWSLDGDNQFKELAPFLGNYIELWYQ